MFVCNCRVNHWGRASPWLSGSNPRDDIRPVDGNDGFFPTSGNELVSSTLRFMFLIIEISYSVIPNFNVIL